MNAQKLFVGFTLLELLITIALTSLLASLCAFESISTFQNALRALSSQTEALLNDAHIGTVLRHSAAPDEQKAYE